MNKLKWGMKACGILLLWAAAAMALPAPTTFTSLHIFDGTDGQNPYAGLVQGTNGKFYGTTYIGGANGYGTVFSFTAGGTLTTLHSFDGTDGQNPYAGLVQGTNGKFYGTTYKGGANGYGTVFSITAGGTLTASMERMARAPPRGWCREPMASSTGQPTKAGRTAMARSSASPQAAR